MEAGRLTPVDAAAVPCLVPCFAPYFTPVARWVAATDPRASRGIDLARLNAFAVERAVRTEAGRPLRFVDSREAARAAPGVFYERLIDETGCVPTRTRGDGVLHDWFNALAWLAFPRTKARLNAVHARELCASGREAPSAGLTPGSDDHGRAPAGARRGRARDVATLLDESGAAFVCSNERLREAFVERDWKTLFVRERVAFSRDVRVVVFGHAAYEKLVAPFKSICAHALVLAPPAAFDDSCAFVDAVDAALADLLRVERFAQLPLHPLPLLGVPGWCEANEDATWYDDESVFRRRRTAAHAGNR